MTATRTLTAMLGNAQKLDGGSMYGNCPRPVWERWSPADDLGRIDLACRALLVEEHAPGSDSAPRRVLFETGIGAFFEPKLRERFGVVEPQHVLLDSLSAHGLSHEDIDVVVLSHLHFDHAGGLLSAWAEGQEPELLFPSATYVVGRSAWERASQPHSRDRVSFLPVLNALLEQSGRLEVVDGETSPTLGEGYRFHYSDGHTPGLLMTEIDTDQGPLVFVGDLIPGMPWMHLPISMGYDRFPERVIDEKAELLTDLLGREGSVFFTHDPQVGFAKVARDAKGRFSGVAWT
ncbi:MAG: MBL fold metallo-hydrolase [Planctomycetota bacterium]|nr:MBL fold metallo-hydrolase [Planctomycetota bacterium]